MKTPTYLWLFFIALPFLLSGQAEKKDPVLSLGKLVEDSPVFSKIFTGFALYDPATKKMIYQKDAHKYYTPASNTKIFTLYTSLQILKDQIPLLRYVEQGDSIFFWGTGNPIFLHEAFPIQEAAWNFLSQTNKKLFFLDHNFLDQPLGPGWAWDDYAYYYQAEKSAFPIYGNTTWVRWDQQSVTVEPSFFAENIAPAPKGGPAFYTLDRALETNTFLYADWIQQKDSMEYEIPFTYSSDLLVQLLSDTLQKEVAIGSLSQLNRTTPKVIYAPLQDTLLKRLMHDSDNFVAEQLLLMCSDQIFGVLNTDKVIDYAKDALLGEAPDEVVWRDGSGLSRYNLFTPRTIIHVLDLLYASLPTERLFDIFPAGGYGTLKNLYQGESPYVYAKTGTLSNKHCLSGYIKTDNGRTLIFSFMNNNYINSNSPVKAEMDQILRWIKENY